MFKVGTLSDQTLRPWTFDQDFDGAIADQCSELDKAHKRTSPFKKGGDYAFLQGTRKNKSDTRIRSAKDRQRAASPSIVPTFGQSVVSRRRSANGSHNKRESMRELAPLPESNGELPTIVRSPASIITMNSPMSSFPRPTTAPLSKPNNLLSKQGNLLPKECPVLEGPESSSLDNDSPDTAKVIYNQISNLSTSVDAAHISHDAVLSAPFVEVTVPKMDDNKPASLAIISPSPIGEILRPKTAMPRISSAEAQPKSSYSGLTNKSKSTPNLFGSSYIREEREKEELEDSLSWARRRPSTTPGNQSLSDSSPLNLHNFATQDFSHKNRAEGAVLGRRKVKQMKSLEEQMMTESGSQNLNLHPNAGKSHRDEIVSLAAVSRNMTNGIKADHRVDRAWSAVVTPGLHLTSNYTSQMNFTHKSNDSFARSINMMDKSQYIKIDALSKWTLKAAVNNVQIFSPGGTMKFN